VTGPGYNLGVTRRPRLTTIAWLLALSGCSGDPAPRAEPEAPAGSAPIADEVEPAPGRSALDAALHAESVDEDGDGQADAPPPLDPDERAALLRQREQASLQEAERDDVWREARGMTRARAEDENARRERDLASLEAALGAEAREAEAARARARAARATHREDAVLLCLDEARRRAAAAGGATPGATARAAAALSDERRAHANEARARATAARDEAERALRFARVSAAQRFDAPSARHDALARARAAHDAEAAAEAAEDAAAWADEAARRD
jgi:hypothetical protein